MSDHLLLPLCLLGGIFLTVLGIVVNRAVTRYIDRHVSRALAPVTPLHPDRPHVKVVGGTVRVR